MAWTDILQLVVLGNPLSRWAIGLGIVVAIMLGYWVIKAVAWRAISARADRLNFTATVIQGVIGRLNAFLVLLIALHYGALALHISDAAGLWLHTIAIIAFIVQVGWCLDKAIILWITYYQEKTVAANAARVTTVHAFGYILRVAVLTLLLLLALDNVPGVEVTALMASLGVAGIAVALALQNVLSDLFASMSIALDKPFVIGDFIIIGDFMGTVEKIGVKTTRLRSLTGEYLIFANSDMLSSRIRNYTRMHERRIVFSLGVTYNTPYEKLHLIPTMIQKIIEAQEETRFDRAHFASYGDFSLNFEIVYYVLSADYNRYMDIQQAINLAIFKAFEDTGIEFAFPTQTLYLANPVEARMLNGQQPAAPAASAAPQQQNP
jgi:small-conductance mechanosensitive channel